MINHPYWNWQQTDWPTFRFGRSKLDAMEAQFLRIRPANCIYR